MNKKTIIWLIIAVSLITIGSAIFTGVMMLNNWNFGLLSTRQYETNEHKITDTFSNINIEATVADVQLIPSQNNDCRIICSEYENQNHSVSVVNSTLTIREVDKSKWYEHIGFHFNVPRIDVYLPQKVYDSLRIVETTGNVKIPNDFTFCNMDVSLTTGKMQSFASCSEAFTIKTTTGDISIADSSINALSISVKTGKVDIQSVVCSKDITANITTGKIMISDTTAQNLDSTGSTGNIALNNVIVQEEITIKRSTGSIAMDSCDAGSLYIRTDTGDIKGSLLSDKVFIASTDTGSIKIPQTTSGGKCELITDTGNINITIK